MTSAFGADGEASNLLVTDDTADLVSHRAFGRAPHGVGDLLAALYLAHRLRDATPIAALGAATAATTALVERAFAEGADELPLAAGQDALLAPPEAPCSVTRLAGLVAP